jgi:hypothetical protein
MRRSSPRKAVHPAPPQDASSRFAKLLAAAADRAPPRVRRWLQRLAAGDGASSASLPDEARIADKTDS